MNVSISKYETFIFKLLLLLIFFPQIRCPALMVTASQDKFCPPGCSNQMELWVKNLLNMVILEDVFSEMSLWSFENKGFMTTAGNI